MVGERLRQAFDREPILRRIQNRVSGGASRTRNTPGKTLQSRLPQFPNRNFGGGVAVGSVEAGIALVLEETLGIPFGSDTEIVDSQEIPGGMLYTVNVDAPFENMARARAFFEAQTGFTSLLTDLLDVREVRTVKTRAFRDTYQIEVSVRE